MNHLAQGVHAGIRAPRRDGVDGRAMNFRQGPLHMILDGATAGLGLPATKPPPVILDPQGYALSHRLTMAASTARGGRKSTGAMGRLRI
jgi:hypothetical protein